MNSRVGIVYASERGIVRVPTNLSMRIQQLWKLPPSACVGLFLLCWAPTASSYSVLTHEAIIDSVWDSSIKVLLLQRFPNATAEELTAAHAYAYGGSIIQDLGYPVQQQVLQRFDALRPERRLHPQHDSRVSRSRRVCVRADGPMSSLRDYFGVGGTTTVLIGCTLAPAG